MMLRTLIATSESSLSSTRCTKRISTNIRNKFLQILIQKRSEQRVSKIEAPKSQTRELNLKALRTFLKIPNKEFLKKEAKKISNIIKLSKKRGRELAKKEWENICQTKSRSNSRYEKSISKIKNSRYNIIQQHLKIKSRSIDCYKKLNQKISKKAKRKENKYKGNEIKIYENISQHEMPELSRCLAPKRSIFNVDILKMSPGLSLDPVDRSFKLSFTSEPAHLSSSMSNAHTNLTVSNSQTLAKGDPSRFKVRLSGGLKVNSSYDGGSTRHEAVTVLAKPRKRSRDWGLPSGQSEGLSSGVIRARQLTHESLSGGRIPQTYLTNASVATGASACVYT
ncbi:unnamed protein product [Moneuplotes crassus]|uniref:Uncharacterized protein n=1 Tax=Euplotes crassus TaxID=5936 RepID=A0AAD1X8F3_EUPCR|nr:unnamed protein product [Moneuplotes crassus]